MDECMKFILHGRYDNKDDTLEAREILEKRQLPYRLEWEKETDTGQIELVSPIGRLSGLNDIRFYFG